MSIRKEEYNIIDGFMKRYIDEQIESLTNCNTVSFYNSIYDLGDFNEFVEKHR